MLSHKEKGKEENGHCHHFYSMTNKQKICHCSNACKKMHRDWGEKNKTVLIHRQQYYVPNKFQGLYKKLYELITEFSKVT